MPSSAFLRASEALWKARHTYRDRKVRAWDRKRSYRHGKWVSYRTSQPEGGELRSKWYGLYMDADHAVRRWAQLRSEASEKLTLRRRQLKQKLNRPRFFYTRHRPRGHRGLLVGSVTRVAGHYTASPQETSTADARGKLEGLARYHHDKWGDWLEYHVCVTVDGDIVWNRPARLMGYGVGGSNTGTLHVVMLGTTGDRPTAEQQKALRWLVNNWHTSRVPKQFRAPKDMSRVPWLGHKDFPPPGGQTACPGEFITVYRTKGAQR